MNPDLIAKRYAEYRQQRQQHTQLLQELERQRLLERQTILEKLKQETEPHKTRKPHVCERCGETIPAGSMTQTRRVAVGYGYPEGTHYTTYYRHFPDCPKKERKVYAERCYHN